MKKVGSSGSSQTPRKIRPALTPEARENQMIALAVDLAEKQLQDGTASSQVITHYLKLGASTAKLEKTILEKQAELMAAKADKIKSDKRSEQLMERAIEAMKRYSGNARSVYEDDDENRY